MEACREPRRGHAATPVQHHRVSLRAGVTLSRAPMHPSRRATRDLLFGGVVASGIGFHHAP
jgi:hypothetical protein